MSSCENRERAQSPELELQMGKTIRGRRLKPPSLLWKCLELLNFSILKPTTPTPMTSTDSFNVTGSGDSASGPKCSGSQSGQALRNVTKLHKLCCNKR
ncbi:hypothetical protein LEMLEM_LOCUS16942, partial [Lemmus lemmus]